MDYLQNESYTASSAARTSADSEARPCFSDSRLHASSRLGLGALAARAESMHPTASAANASKASFFMPRNIGVSGLGGNPERAFRRDHA